MKLYEYAGYDALGLAELVKRREVSRRELAECSLTAIAAMNPTLNAVIETYADTVQSLDDKPDDSNRTFYGVPFLLKDIGSHDAGVKFEMGSRLTKDLRAPPFASELVNRFRGTGITVMGRTNIPELGSCCTTEPLLYGPTRNPWNVEHIPGGSSGGAAAAISSGMVPIAHANDAGGSIRWPAACCGLFGLKPSRNLNPVGPDVALPVNGFAAEHILSRSVRDSAAMLDATAGIEVGAWCYTPRFEGSYLAETRKPTGRLRIGINLNAIFPPTELEQEVVDAVLATGKLCESLGHVVETVPFEFDHEAVLRGNYVMWSSGIRHGIEELSAITGRQPSAETLEPHNLAAYEAAASMTAVDLQKALAQLNDISRAYGRYFQRYDVMLTPTGSRVPVKLGVIPAMDTGDFFKWYMGMCSTCPFTSSVNMAGIPAMSMPLARSRSGLPIGLHFIAAMGQEPLLFRLAAQLEAAQPWDALKPAVHASRLNK